MRSKGCDGARTIHSLIYRRARERRGARRASTLWDDAPASKAEADRHRRMLDGRRGARPRPAVLRRAGAGARRSGAAAADPGRRLLHRGRARRHADRGAPAGRRTIRSSACRWTCARASGSSPATTARPQVVRARRARSAARARRRPGAGRPQRDAARLQHAHARAARLRRRAAGRRRQAGLPAQQPQARACSTAACGR